MKLFIVAALALTTQAFAATPASIEDCAKITDSIDRQYCQDKYIANMKKVMSKEETTWKKNGITAKDKTAKMKEVKSKVTTQKEIIKMMQAELAVMEAHQNTLETAKVKAEAKPKKKKKDNSLAGQLGIKL